MAAWMESRWREELAEAQDELAGAEAAARRAGLTSRQIARIHAAVPKLP
jgi:hypothetical protein